MSQAAASPNDRRNGRQSSAAATAPALIAVDWGTTSFRAYLASADGQVLAARETGQGILKVENGAFADTLVAATRDWFGQHGPLPILMAGMIGSRQGWREAPYARCPARAADLSVGLTHVDVPGLASVAIIAGVTTQGLAERPDVMRGEETQIFGALAGMRLEQGIFVLPGTHSKWVRIDGGAIVDFTTYMTGEVFAALKDHTILGRLMTPGPGNGDGFVRGLDAARHMGGGAGALLSGIFSARTLALFDALAGSDVADYLSGLLIGAEIVEAARNASGVVIVGNSQLSTRYADACRHLAITAATAPADCVVIGLAAIARAAGLIGART